MRFFLIIVIFLYGVILQADYLRTITIASFSTEKKANRCVYQFKKTFEKNRVFSAMQEEIGFYLKVKKSKQYYVVKLEPFTNRQALQIIVDIIRKKYKDIYVQKLKVKVLTCDDKIEEIQKVDTSEKITIVEKIKEIKVIQKVEVESKKLLLTLQKETEKKTLFQILFSMSSFIVILLLFILFWFKKELQKNKVLLEAKKTQENDIFEDIDFEDIDFDESELDDIKITL